MRLPGWAERSPGGGKRTALEMAVIVRSEPIRVILASGWGGWGGALLDSAARGCQPSSYRRKRGAGQPGASLLPVLAGICQGEAVGQAR